MYSGFSKVGVTCQTTYHSSKKFPRPVDATLPSPFNVNIHIELIVTGIAVYFVQSLGRCTYVVS